MSRKYEYRKLIFKNESGGWDPTPRTDEVVAELNRLGAEGWHPIHANAGGLWLLERETE